MLDDVLDEELDVHGHCSNVGVGGCVVVPGPLPVQFPSTAHGSPLTVITDVHVGVVQSLAAAVVQIGAVPPVILQLPSVQSLFQVHVASYVYRHAFGNVSELDEELDELLVILSNELLDEELEEMLDEDELDDELDDVKQHSGIGGYPGHCGTP